MVLIRPANGLKTLDLDSILNNQQSPLQQVNLRKGRVQLGYALLLEK